MDVQGYSMPDDLYYHKEHVWARIEGNKAKVGLDDFTQKLAREMSYIEAPIEGDEVKQGEEVGTVETGKWVGKIYTPVSGKIIEVNALVIDDPTVVNLDPYGRGWIFEIEMTNPDEIKIL